jgi:pimeloyl-ACP methyl ester carboxylesterase
VTLRHLTAIAPALLLLSLVRTDAAPQAPQIETGEIDKAPFRIEIPANWNKGLIMYAHGYQPAGTPVSFDRNDAALMRAEFVSRGFAIAESGYRVQGWAVKEALEDTEALRRYFASKYGAPVETYITGHSMGGHITIATIERHADAYQGAMPLCGPLGPALEFFNNGVFDMLVTFEALFPGSIGSPYQAALANVGKAKAAMAAAPERAQRYAHHFDRTVDDLPNVLAFFQLIMQELKQRAGGEPFDNRNRIYTGFGDDVALNRTVKRYTADPAAREYVKQNATPTGRITDPVLALHTTADPLVLASDVTAYEVPAMLAGTWDRFVVRYVEANGHCRFPPATIGHAFDTLRAWAKGGSRPAGGEQK